MLERISHQGLSKDAKELEALELMIFDQRSLILQENILRDPRVKELLSRLKKFNEDTYQHSLRVGLLSIDLGYGHNIDDLLLTDLAFAAYLHDIGKTEIDLDILDKKSGLTEEERAAVKQHVRQSIRILGENGFSERSSAIVASHHESQTRSYPRAHQERRDGERKGERRGHHEEAQMAGEILAIADIADALIWPRAYKLALPKEKVREIMMEEFQGDPALIEEALKRFK
ncbi:MAG: HD domain-containing phosphohydrolase [Candidatus Paceibacterota bacterium]|jgi:putative nucleotidyltransferase with HDIG domain